MAQTEERKRLRLLCKLGFHDYTVWSEPTLSKQNYIDEGITTSVSVQTKHCQKCNKTVIQTI